MRVFIRAALALLVLTPLACSAEEGAQYELGKHYKNVASVQPPSDPSKIEVTEVFWYGCPHCFQFESYVSDYLERKPGDVKFERLPSSLGRPVGIVHSKAFYAAELLGITEKVHKPLFAAIHTQGKNMLTADELKDFFVKHGGIGVEDFDGAFTGFAVDSRVRRAEGAIREMGISSVPSVVVGGRYYTSGSLAGGYDKVFKVVDFLVQKIRDEKKSN